MKTPKREYQYIQIDYNDKLYKIGITFLEEPEKRLQDLQTLTVGKDIILFKAIKTNEGYAVIFESYGVCVSRVLNHIDHNISNIVKELQ